MYQDHMKSPVIALITDFGLSDWYVGVMRSVILSINPVVNVVDVAHTIPRHNLHAASFVILASYRYLPRTAVVVVVVDPGVGGRRRVICAGCRGRVFLAPDNGVLTGVLTREGYDRLVSVENERLFLSPVSTTFHGRDIFAAVAGHLSLGLAIDRLGPDVTDFEKIDIPVPQLTDESLVVTVQWIDSFGNVITNCPEGLAAEVAARWGGAAGVGGYEGTLRLADTYESVEAGRLLGIVGSSGYLEISVREGNAGDLLDLTIGSDLVLRPAG